MGDAAIRKDNAYLLGEPAKVDRITSPTKQPELTGDTHGRMEVGGDDASDQLVRNLSMLVMKMARTLSRFDKDKWPAEAVMAEKAMDFIMRHNLQESPLRNEIENGKPNDQ